MLERILPVSLMLLNINGEFNQPIILQNRIYHISINGNFNQSIILTDSIFHINIADECSNWC